MERLGSEYGARVFVDKRAALAVEAAAVAAVAAAVAAARADLGPRSAEGNGSEVDPSPSEPGCWYKDLKESEMRPSCQKLSRRNPLTFLFPISEARAAALTATASPQ